MKASVQKTTEICFVPIYPHPSGNQTNKQTKRSGWYGAIFAIQLKNKIILVTRCKNYDAIVVRGAYSHWRRI